MVINKNNNERYRLVTNVMSIISAKTSHSHSVNGMQKLLF